MSWNKLKIKYLKLRIESKFSNILDSKFSIMPSHYGFTLIELLVVIAIIAILAVVGFSVFTGAQAQARDGKRRAEIVTLAKSIESNKDLATGVYSYSAADLSADFPTNPPQDPLIDRSYCIAINTSSTTPPNNPNSNNIPGGNVCPPPVGQYTAINLTLPLPANTLSWTLCAALERGTESFCVKSLYR